MTLIDDRLITESGLEIARVMESEESGLVRIESYGIEDDSAFSYRTLQ